MSASLLFLLISSCAHRVTAGSFFPCHSAKGLIHTEVECTSVKLPHSICSKCPLRQTLSDGSFEQCDRIYDTSSPQCISSLRQYVDFNPCDVRRASALKHLQAGDESVRNELDYFLYSICEQCCDCVPMGVKTSDYAQLSQRHSTSTPALWSETRGNCPAHARYDVCKIFPTIKSFGSISNDVAICGQLTAWVGSEAAEEWQSNPEVIINGDIQSFLRDILVATQCEEIIIWNKCQIMEDRQHHLDLPSGSETENAVMTELSEQVPPAPVSESGSTLLNSSGFEAVSENGNDDNASGDEAPDLSDESIIASAQAPSESTIVGFPSQDENGASTTATGSNSSDTIADIGDSDILEGSGTYKPPLLPGMRSCFPGSSIVRRRDGSLIRMENLRVGDEILVSNARYSPIYTFSHRSHNVYSEFVSIRTANHSLHLSSKHNLYVNGELRAAGLVKKGEYIKGQFGVEEVVHVGREWKWGLYNPHTINGEIVVNGILCSCFTDEVSLATGQGLLFPFRAAFLTGAKDWMLGWLMRDGIELF